MNHSRVSVDLFKATSVAFFFGALRRFWLAGLLCIFLAQGAWGGTWRVRAAEVLDGDTLVLASGERLRLRGIDAPEIRHKGSPGQYHGEESRRILQTLVAGRDLFLDRSELGTDRYGRMVGQVRLGDGRTLSLLLVESGAAFVYPHPSDTDKGMAGRLLAAQTSAMNKGLGFWPKLLAAPAAGKAYLGTRSSRRFHALSCATGRKVKPANQVRFSSLREAFAAGYAPARECTPWLVR
jgi:micrococcal nuclease